MGFGLQLFLEILHKIWEYRCLGFSDSESEFRSCRVILLFDDDGNDRLVSLHRFKFSKEEFEVVGLWHDFLSKVSVSISDGERLLA